MLNDLTQSQLEVVFRKSSKTSESRIQKLKGDVVFELLPEMKNEWLYKLKNQQILDASIDNWDTEQLATIFCSGGKSSIERWDALTHDSQLAQLFNKINSSEKLHVSHFSLNAIERLLESTEVTWPKNLKYIFEEEKKKLQGSTN